MGEEEEIQEKTKEYWKIYDPSKLDETMESYIENLLKTELEFARQAGRITANPCETLVLLVGFSLEPLLQSVCVHEPKEVILLLNKTGYPGETHEMWDVFAQHVTKAIGHLVEKRLLDQPPEFPGEKGKQGYPVADSPDAVFQTLVDVLHDETDVVIDVTGGKKSMVSGAYLYAAYAGARISYVDFEEYDPKYRRPYGYSCKIGELANPYQEFALREWERIRTLYNRYQFREARQLIGNIQPQMTHVLPESVEPLKKLVAVLEYYEYWDSGDFRKAKQSRAAQWLDPQKQPGAVVDLGDQWFEIAGNDFSQKPGGFYGNLPALQIYVCDELARIRRLIDYNEDYRSAFLRAGGVNEIVMLARVVALVLDGNDKDSLLNALDKRTPDVRRVFSALLDPNKTTIDVQKDIPFKNAPGLRISRPSPMTPWWKRTGFFNADDGWDTFLTRRNELAHKYFSVPKEWAEDALAFVRANFEDFLGHPIGHLQVRTDALPWSDLCDLCGLSRFLPPTLR